MSTKWCSGCGQIDLTGMPCWGDFASMRDAAADGLLGDLAGSVLIYISGRLCPDFSSAGCDCGLLGETVGFWLDDCELGIRLRPPVIIREMVTGIFDVDSGAPFWEAVDRFGMPATPSDGRCEWRVAMATRPRGGVFSWWPCCPSVCAKE